MINLNKLQDKLQALYPAHLIEVQFQDGCETYIDVFINRKALNDGFTKSVEIRDKEEVFEVTFYLNPRDSGPSFDYATEMIKKLTEKISDYIQNEAKFDRLETLGLLKEIQDSLEYLQKKVPSKFQSISYDDYEEAYSLTKALHNVQKITERIEKNGN